MKKNKLNDGHYLEAMDRLHLITEMMDNFLMNHPVIHKNKDLKKLVNFSMINLMEVYQRVGKISYEKENERKGIHKVVLRRRENSED